MKGIRNTPPPPQVAPPPFLPRITLQVATSDQKPVKDSFMWSQWWIMWNFHEQFKKKKVSNTYMSDNNVLSRLFITKYLRSSILTCFHIFRPVAMWANLVFLIIKFAIENHVFQTRICQYV